MIEQFKGIDWTELADYWGFEGETEEERCELLKTHLITWKDKQDILNKATVVRQFLKKLIEQANKICYTGPLWQGLYNIDHNEIFLQYVRILLYHMWV